MKLLVLDIPDDPAELPAWLDRRLVDGGLLDLVAELEAIHPRPDSPAPSIDAALSVYRAAVLLGGLGSLPTPSLRLLLRNPRLLVDLRDLILDEGGDYWPDLARRDPDLARSSASSWLALRPRLARPDPHVPTIPATAPDRSRPLLLKLWAASATIAATVLGLAYILDRPAPIGPAPPPVATRPAWGWDAPTLLDPAPSRPAYLTRLADLASGWFDARPATPADLAVRLGDLRTGCTRLIVSDHPSLPPADRSWLVSRCRDWSAKLDDAVHDLESGAPPDQVRADVDAIVTRLIKALRDRAASA